MDSLKLKSESRECASSSQWNTCLICWRSQNVSKSKELSQQYFQWGSTEVRTNNESCLDVHLVSVFVLRKLLNYPEKQLVKMMEKTCGNSPGDWFVLCEPCLKVAYQAWCLHVQLSKVESQLQKIRNSLITQFQENTNDSAQCPNANRRKETINVRDVVRSYFNDQFTLKNSQRDQNITGYSQRDKCLICLRSQNSTQCKELVSQYFQIWGSNDNKAVNESCLDSHLVSIFVLRKLLNYPGSECVKVLKKTKGSSPGDWFVFCEPCLKSVHQAWQCQVEICKIQRQLQEIQKRTRSQLEDNKNGWDCGLPIDFHRRKETGINVREEIRNYFKGQMSGDVSTEMEKESLSIFSNDGGSTDNEDDVLFSPDAQSSSFQKEPPMHRKLKRILSSSKIKSCSRLKLSSGRAKSSNEISNSSSDEDTNQTDIDYIPGTTSTAMKRKRGRPPKIKSSLKIPRITSLRQKIELPRKIRDSKSRLSPIQEKKKGKRIYQPETDNFTKLSSAVKNNDDGEPNKIYEAPLGPNRNGLSAGVLTHQPSILPVPPSTIKMPVVYAPKPTGKKQCEICGISFFGIIGRGIDSHMKRHRAKNKSFFCQICNYPSQTQKGLEMHMTKFHPPDISTQSISELEASCANRDELVKILLRSYHSVTILTNKSELVCPICNATVISSKIRVHIHRHGVKYQDFECKLCRYPSENKKKLKFHMRKKHKSELLPEELEAYTVSCKSEPTPVDNVCYICGKNYSNKSVLKKHLSTAHDVHLKFNCEKCHLPFNSASDLQSHMKSEHGQTRVMCYICGKDYCDNHGLKNHLKQVHGIQHRSTSHCPICGASFRLKTQALLELHMKKKHPGMLTEFAEVSQCGEDNVETVCTDSVNSGDIKNINIIDNLTTQKKIHVPDEDKLHGKATKDCLKTFEDEDDSSNETQNEQNSYVITDKIMHVPENKLHVKITQDSLDTCEKATDGLNKNQPGQTSEHKLVCGECGLKFTRRYRLTKHVKNFHSAEGAANRRKVCTICGLVCVNLRGLKCHVREAHNELFVFQCQNCKVKFKTTRQLSLHHKRKVHCKAKEECIHCSIRIEKSKMDKHLELCKPAPALQGNMKKESVVTAIPKEVHFMLNFNDTSTFVTDQNGQNSDVDMRSGGSKLQPENDLSYDEWGNEGIEMSDGNFSDDEDVKYKPIEGSNKQKFSTVPQDPLHLSSLSEKIKTPFKSAHSTGKLLSKKPHKKFTVDFANDTSEERQINNVNTDQSIHVPYDNLDFDSVETTQKSVETCEENTNEQKVTEGLNENQTSQTNQKKFACSQCGLKYRLKYYLNRHVKNCVERASKRQRVCKICGMVCINSRSLRSHGREAHNELFLFQCQICKLGFKTKGNLTSHQKMSVRCKVTEEKEKDRKPKRIQQKEALQCKLCFCRFHPYQKGSYERHMKNHILNEKTTCSLCSYPCKSEVLLAQHMNIYHRKDPTGSTTTDVDVATTLCDGCGFCSSVPHITERHQEFCRQFDQHVTTISKVRFQCNICSNLFLTRRKAIGHLMRGHKEIGHHEGHQCHMCNQKYSTLNSLQRHIKNFHETAICNICNQKFASETRLHYHKKRVHSNLKKEPIICEQCGLHFTVKRILEVHIEKYHNSADSFKYLKNCRHCDVTCVNQRGLTFHMKTAHPELFTFRCEICDTFHLTNFNLKKHIKITHCDNKVKCSRCPVVIEASQIPRHLRLNCTGKSD